MTIPNYINENRSDIRGIKPGWYAMDDAGKLSLGPFSSHEECLRKSSEQEATVRLSLELGRSGREAIDRLRLEKMKA